MAFDTGGWHFYELACHARDTLRHFSGQRMVHHFEPGFGEDDEPAFGSFWGFGNEKEVRVGRFATEFGVVVDLPIWASDCPLDVALFGLFDAPASVSDVTLEFRFFTGDKLVELSHFWRKENARKEEESDDAGADDD